MVNPSIDISAVVLDADPRAATIECNGRLTVGMNYLVEAHGLKFLAGKIMWVRGGRAGLFFRHSIHPDTLDRLRPSPTQSAVILLRRVP
jgi:hypothetical protein